MSNIIPFEPFKHAKQWDKNYPKFLGKVEQCFGAKTDPEEMHKRLYYAMRYLDGVSNSFMIFSLLAGNMKSKEMEKGRKYCIDWLEDIIKKLK